MIRYIIKRLLALIPVTLCVTFIVFFILSMTKGDPVRIMLGDGVPPEVVEQTKEEMGLNDPLLVQYVHYVIGLLHGDMGVSYMTQTAVSQEIADRIPKTFMLAGVATVFAVAMALPLGIIAAVKQNTPIDASSMVLSLIGISMPEFWLGLLLILLFSSRLGWLPSGGADTPANIILPAFTLACYSMASISRITRSSMLEVIRQDYVRTARAKGLSERKVITKHALRNALMPTVTVLGIQLACLMGGTAIVESVFAWPGIGRYMMSAINNRDVPAVMGCMILFSVTMTIANCVVDLIYAFLDPRIKAEYR